MSIGFGTDGWRAVIAETFTFGNLRLVAQAVADYVNNELVTNGGSQPPEVVVGFDTRFLSDRFAAETARVLAANGIITWLSRTDAPTPAISFNVKHKQAAAGVVITASHNPPRYSGFKLKAAYGGSALPEQCTQVERLLEVAQREARGPNLMDYEKAIEQELIRRFNPTNAYYEHLETLVDVDKISQAELHIVADPMYGSGRTAIRAILSRSRCHVTEIRGEMNPGFGGIHPEPIRKYLDMLAATIQANHADVGLATDGDADRIGAMDNAGTFVDPHTIMSLALCYLAENRGWTGDVVKTVSTTLMIDRIAARHGLTVHETPVGFNYIADYMLKGDVLIGGEESGGISIKGHIPEGDGILMGLLLLEIMAEARVPLVEIVGDLQARFGPACYERTDFHLKKPVPKKEMVGQLQANAPATMAGETVREIKTFDGIKFVLADDSWLLIRPSGTEPVLRVYAEATSPEMVKALLDEGHRLAGP
ncbi:MAG TPA: phosphoglucomutase/phosphomannomutase family protein [Aggregatilineaceae bacterium]|nr:phosphoglucomutase/phosphomannomutase family protein [Aggregatilineaceae bacterium]